MICVDDSDLADDEGDGCMAKAAAGKKGESHKSDGIPPFYE